MGTSTAEVEQQPDEDRACAPSVRVARLLSATEAGIAARLIETARAVVFACGDEALALKGFASVEELTPAQVRRWRAEAKADAVTELQVSTGRGAEECRHLVALACAPASVRGPVIEALDAGTTSWRQVQAFWRRCARLEPGGATAVAETLFGQDAALMARERLDPDGEPVDEPWQHQRYATALEREATAVEGVDVTAERTRRREAYAARRVSTTVDQDGTGTITIGSDLIRVCGAYARLDRAARLLRKAGDERSLDQLRSDIATMLLVHGHIPGDHAGTAGSRADGCAEQDGDVLLDDLWSPAQEEKSAQVLAGMPTIAMQVVVPWDTLTSSVACTRCGHGRTTPPDDRRQEQRHGGTGALLSRRLATHAPAPERGAAAAQGRSVPAAGTVSPGPQGAGVVRGQVGQILGSAGRPGVFISPGHARELALTPGSTLHRLLVDPADGRLIERTIATYRPDADMRWQIITADVTARVPWSTHPASACELDHVQPWTGEDGGGQTTEANLAALPIRPHQAKTARKHAAIINERRDLTWTTLLAQSSPTRVHDYRQYLARIRYQMDADEFPDTLVAEDIDHAARAAYREGAHSTVAGQQRAAADHGGYPAPDWARLRSVPNPGHPSRTLPVAMVDTTDPQAREALRDLASQALYAALVTRGPKATLEDLDDLPGATEHGGQTGGWMFVTHRRDGVRRPGPAPDQPTPEQLLDTDPSYSRHLGFGTRNSSPGAGRASDSRSAPEQDRPWGSSEDHGPPPF